MPLCHAQTGSSGSIEGPQAVDGGVPGDGEQIGSGIAEGVTPAPLIDDYEQRIVDHLADKVIWQADLPAAQVAFKILAALRDEGLNLLLKFLRRDHAAISPRLLIACGVPILPGNCAVHDAWLLV